MNEAEELRIKLWIDVESIIRYTPFPGVTKEVNDKVRYRFAKKSYDEAYEAYEALSLCEYEVDYAWCKSFEAVGELMHELKCEIEKMEAELNI